MSSADHDFPIEFDDKRTKDFFGPETLEILKSVRKRAVQYCIAAYNNEPDEIHIEDDGTLQAVFSAYNIGEYTEDNIYFDLTCLTKDLEIIYDERKKREEEERIRAEKMRKILEKEKESRLKEDRRQEYLKLKKEFEP